MTEIALAVARQLLLFTALLLPLQILLPAQPRQPLLRKGLPVDLLHFCLNPFLINLGAALLLGGLAALFERLLPVGLRKILQAQPFALQLAEIFVVSEVLGYFAHRLSHAVPALWRFHSVHHSTEQLDFLAAHRQHPIEAVVLLGVSNLPVLVLGFDTTPLLTFIVVQKLYTAFVHANVRIGYGPLEGLLASPRFHHWHHHNEPGAAAQSVNFASTLSLLDRLFGTFRAAPAGRFPVRYGVDEPVAEGYLGQLAHPLRARGPGPR